MLSAFSPFLYSVAFSLAEMVLCKSCVGLILSETWTSQNNSRLTAAEVNKGVIFHHFHLVDDLRHQVERGLSIHLRGEGLIVVQLLRVGH